MKDTTISPPDNSSDSASEAKIYVKLSSISVDDGSGGSTAPEVGDEVTISEIKGTVKSVDGDVACIDPTEVNGEPAPDLNKPAPVDQRAELRKQAESADASQLGY